MEQRRNENIRLINQWNGLMMSDDDDDDDVQSKRRELAVKRMEKKFTDSRVKVMQILQHRTGGEDEDIETLHEQLNFNNYY